MYISLVQNARHLATCLRLLSTGNYSRPVVPHSETLNTAPPLPLGPSQSGDRVGSINFYFERVRFGIMKIYGTVAFDVTLCRLSTRTSLLRDRVFWVLSADDLRTVPRHHQLHLRAASCIQWLEPLVSRQVPVSCDVGWYNAAPLWTYFATAARRYNVEVQWSPSCLLSAFHGRRLSTVILM